jgi:hypothetical protein
MTTHMCQGLETNGTVASCGTDGAHGAPVIAAADVRPYNDERTRLRVEGIAQTGQVSDKGTVKHLDYWSGRVAAKVAPGKPVALKMMSLPWFRERFEYRDGKLYDKATGKECAWTRNGSHRSKTVSSQRKPTVQSLRHNGNVSPKPGGNTGKLIVPQRRSA